MIMKKPTDSLAFAIEPTVHSDSVQPRFHLQRRFYFLFLFITTGVLSGSAFSLLVSPGENTKWIPMLFSGIPNPTKGFMFCFSTLLLNQVLFLILTFLLGVTAFGLFSIPLLVLFKGFTMGVGTSYYLISNGFSGLWESAITYAPVLAIGSFLFLLLSVRAFHFSNQFVKVGFFSETHSETNLNFKVYLKDFLFFIMLAVASSFLGAFLSYLYLIIFI